MGKVAHAYGIVHEDAQILVLRLRAFPSQGIIIPY